MSDDDELDYSRILLKNALGKVYDIKERFAPNTKQHEYYDTMYDVLLALDYSCMVWRIYAHMYKKTNDRLTIIESALAHLIRDSQKT